MKLDEITLILEAALLSATEPLTVKQLQQMFDSDISPDILTKLLHQLQETWQARSAELVCLSSGWRFRTKVQYQAFLVKLQEQRPVRYSRAVLETLAIIAYRQPVTRGDIEDIRGVAVAPNILKTLESRGWIDIVGHRDTPGRPALFATTQQFLNDLGLRVLTELPPLIEIERIMNLVNLPETVTPTQIN